MSFFLQKGWRSLLLLAVVGWVTGCTKEEPEPHRSYTCVASYYGKDWHGRQTANGEIFDHRALTAAHKKLPFDTKVRVTNPKTGKSVVVRINDRGPYVRGREFDLSEAAAKRLGMTEDGVCRVKVEILELGHGRYIHPEKRKEIAREKKRTKQKPAASVPPPELCKKIAAENLI